MNKEQEKVWERLKYVKPKSPWGLPSTSFIMAGRAMGKSTMVMQAFGRALRNGK